ncbi:hypothetical protein [Sinorhizobium fredii]|uniref:hypothetical protein n=1 Tax=Rhizobium fredii TaxID=380 RepID=UPI0005956A4E|nr:hypothetical protein [Sinorhizobium fredii]WOS61634.1 hypothetical protein SFGR64A_11800 [Sinorhizobium fredii GR64]
MKQALFATAAILISAMSAEAADMDGPLVGGFADSGASYEEASPAVASPVVGYVEGELHAGKTSDSDLDSKGWALRGAVNFDAGSGLNLQADGGYGQTDVDDADYDNAFGAAHVYYRPTQDYALGAFFQSSRLGTGFASGLAGGSDDVTDNSGGIEAAYFDAVGTAYTQLGYGKSEIVGLDADHYFGKIGARLYLTDNMRIDGEVGLHNFDFDVADAKLDLTTASIIGNYRPEFMPVTVFAGYRFDRASLESGGIDFEPENSHTLTTGLRYNFGSSTLKQEERSGPAWTTTTLLP